MDAHVIQREYENRYPGLNSRYMAYCYAVGMEPTERPDSHWMVWLTNSVAKARKEIGKYRGPLTPEEHRRCDDIVWRYAVEERDGLLLDD